jgi:hypothetical protein
MSVNRTESEEKRQRLGELLRKKLATRTYPVTPAQQMLLLADERSKGDPRCHIAVTYRIRGPLDTTALQAAFGELVRRHESLRTHFIRRGGDFVQVVHDPGPVSMPIIDLSAIPLADRDAEIHQRAAEELIRPFDLASGPLLRTTLLRFGDEDHILQRSIHRIVADGWSLGVLALELPLHYAAFRAGTPPSLPELGMQYGQYALSESERLRPEALEPHLQYWIEKLRGVEPLLDTVRGREGASKPGARGKHHYFEVPASCIDRLRTLSRERGASLFMTTLTAWKMLLSKWLGRADIPVATPIANRDRDELQFLVGLFGNILLLRTSTAGDPTFDELLTRVKATALEAYAHQDVSCGELSARLPCESQERSIFFDLLFALQLTPLPSFSLEKTDVSVVPFDGGPAKSDLALYIWERGGKYTGDIEFNAEVFAPATIAALGSAYAEGLETILREPSLRISKFPLTINEGSPPAHGSATAAQRTES